MRWCRLSPVPKGWWTVKRNGLPVRHFPGKEKAERYATDPEYRASLVEGKMWEKAKGSSPGRAICLAIAGEQAQPFGGGISIGTSVVDGNILNSKGVHVGVVVGGEVFGLKGQKLYGLKGSNIYKLNGDLVGHLSDVHGAVERLDKATDKLFPST
jgi:hypothetical protein